MTEPWVSSDTKIWGFDSEDNILWYPDSTSNITWDQIWVFDTCYAEYGRINSGLLSHTYIDNDNKFILSEMNTAPGFCYKFYHWGLPDPNGNYLLRFKGTYGGSAAHEVVFQLYDWDSTSYTTFLTLPSSTFTQNYYANLPNGPQYFDANNVIQIRVLHVSAGNSGHLLRINYWKLHEGSI